MQSGPAPLAAYEVSGENNWQNKILPCGLDWPFSAIRLRTHVSWDMQTRDVPHQLTP
jgi:hypothetical protein